MPFSDSRTKVGDGQIEGLDHFQVNQPLMYGKNRVVHERTT